MSLSRNYLKYIEINYIANEILKDYNPMMYSLVKYGYTAQFVISDEKFIEFKNKENVTLIDIYDYLLENSLIEDVKKVINIDEIDKIVDRSISIENTIKVFLDNLVEKINNIDSKKVIKDIGVILKDISNAKIDIDKKINVK